MLLSKPFVGDPRVDRESRSIVEAGYSVTVLAWNRDGKSVGEASGDPSVEIDLIGPPCPKRNFLKFALKLPLFWLACLGKAKQKEFLVVHAHDFDTLPVGFLISKLQGRPLVYDAHESYAEMIAQDAPHFICRLVHCLEKRLMRGADVVLVANENVAKMIGKENAVVILNCPSESEVPIGSFGRKDAPSKEKMLLGYFGTLEPGRFVLESVSALAAQDKWRMLIGGDGTLAKAVRKASKGSASVEYLGQVPHEQVMRESARCDVLHVMLDPSNENYKISTPLRLFEAMSLGIPSIVAKGTYPAEVVAKEGCGYVCDHDEKAFSELLDRLADDPAGMAEKGKKGREAFDREYNWGKQAAKLQLAYAVLLGTADD
ncbi:MAG TPA: glycosyltransferase family 4 protein [Thermoplasmata archaeon]|nr:glycosyltransferase family 4 protein [Thermoplasmata archaeon]